MSRLAISASGHEQHRWTLPTLRFPRFPIAGRTVPTGATSLAPRRVVEKAGTIAAYALSGIVYLGVLVAVFWV